MGYQVNVCQNMTFKFKIDNRLLKTVHCLLTLPGGNFCGFVWHFLGYAVYSND